MSDTEKRDAMNRNVETLATILHGMWPETPLREPPTSSRPDCYRVAQQLAARGVLAVTSLTDEQAFHILDQGPAPQVHAGEDLRAALRRCATGEPSE